MGFFYQNILWDEGLIKFAKKKFNKKCFSNVEWKYIIIMLHPGKFKLVVYENYKLTQYIKIYSDMSSIIIRLC